MFDLLSFLLYVIPEKAGIQEIRKLDSGSSPE